MTVAKRRWRWCIVHVLHVIKHAREAVELGIAAIFLLASSTAHHEEPLQGHIATLPLAVALEQFGLAKFPEHFLNGQDPVRVLRGQVCPHDKLAVQVVDLDAVVHTFPHLSWVVHMDSSTLDQVEECLWTTPYQTLYQT